MKLRKKKNLKCCSLPKRNPSKVKARPLHSYFKSLPSSTVPTSGCHPPLSLGAGMEPGSPGGRLTGGRAGGSALRLSHLLPPAPVNLSGRAFVTESRCRPCSSSELRFSELPLARGGSPAFPRAPFLSLACTRFLRLLCNLCSLLSAGFLSASCGVLPGLLCSVLPGGLVRSPRSCRGARCPLGSQNTAQGTLSSLPAPQQDSIQAISISKALPVCLLTYSPTAEVLNTKKDSFST